MQQTTMIPNSGIMSVPQIAAASYAVSSPGVTSVSSGETVSGVYIGPDEKMFIYSGGVASNITASGIDPTDISYGRAAVVVSSGGKVIGAKIYLKATLNVKHGYVQSATAESGGLIALYGASGSVLSAVNSGTVNINSESFVSRCVAASGGVIQNNGEIVDAIISSGGSMEVVGSRYLAYATNVFISRGGVVSAGSSSYLSNVYCTGTLNLGYGADAGTVYVYGGGNLQIAENADARRVTVKKFGALNGFTRLSEEYYDSCSFNGLYHEDTYVSSGVTAILSNTHSAFNTQIRGGGVMVVNRGGMANYTRVAAGGSVIVGYGGTASSTQMNGNATAVTSMTVYSGGKAVGVTMSGARMLVEGTASNITLQNAGIMIISSGGRAENIAVDTFGHLTINKYATAANVHISETGYLNGFFFRKETTYQNLGWGGINYVSTKVVGDVVLSSGCTAADTIINSQGGKLTVQSGAKITGPLEIQGYGRGGKVIIKNGGIVDLDISNRSPENAVLLKGWDGLTLVDPDNAITLTVNASDQQTGNYNLATRFYTSPEDFVISVVDTENTQLGTLTIGETQTLSGLNYQLNLTSDKWLSLTVSEIAPAASVSAKSDINGNGVSDVLFQYTGGDHQLGFWLDGTDNWQGQGLSEPAEWDVIGAYDMSSDGKADVVMLGNVTVSGVKGAFVGYRKNGDMSTWENISYLTNAEGIDWQVDVGNLTGNAGKNSILWHAPDLGAVGVWTDGTDNWVSLGTGYDRNWEMIGAGDFDGDGADSILFSYANGAKYYALDLDRSATELGVSDSGWVVQAIGDFSGDGKDDIVAFNAATGLVAKWEDGNSGSWSSQGQLNAADWFIAGAGDYNGDGKDDLLVRQYSTGMLGYYADADLSKWNEMGRGVDMNWAVIA